jgi:hypothetical protein
MEATACYLLVAMGTHLCYKIGADILRSRAELLYEQFCGTAFPDHIPLNMVTTGAS